MPSQTLMPFLSFTNLRGILDIVRLVAMLGYTLLGIGSYLALWKHRGVQSHTLGQVVLHLRPRHLQGHARTFLWR
jgi:hypothetical protein